MVTEGSQQGRMGVHNEGGQDSQRAVASTVIP